ncbi:phage tail assembly protein T [Aliikangiella marina]|uniref:phage tail assembly protein T n=1 Tax=Aliikangiella marina TaxID=1712262 RepID=UPI003CCC87E0
MRRFLFFLARTVFHCPVSDFEHRLSSSELNEWIAYYNLERWGLDREDYRSEQLCAVIANTVRTREMKPFRPQDFAIRRGKKQTQEEQLAIFDNLRAKHGKG